MASSIGILVNGDSTSYETSSYSSDLFNSLLNLEKLMYH